jgi:hypothetical protein
MRLFYSILHRHAQSRHGRPAEHILTVIKDCIPFQDLWSENDQIAFVV